MGFHGAIMVHCRAQEIRAAWQGAGLLRVEGLWMSSRRITGVRQVSVTVGPQPLHGGKEAQPFRRAPGQVEMTDELDCDS